MENQLEKKTENEIDTGAYKGCINYLWLVGNENIEKKEKTTIRVTVATTTFIINIQRPLQP